MNEREAKAAHDQAAAEVCGHVLDCTLGCTMLIVRCPEGQRLAEAERSSWHAYYRARYGEVPA